MKYLLIAFLLVTNLSCATTQVSETKPDYSHLTIQKITEQCEMKNNWIFSVLGAGVRASQFDNCLGISSLVVIGVDVTAYTEDVRRSTLELSRLHFQHYLKQKVDENKSWNVIKIKEENSNGALIYFYTISSQNIECADNICKRRLKE
jgi:hypothetical protein